MRSEAILLQAGKKGAPLPGGFWKWRMRRALGGERREERRCEVEAIAGLRFLREKPRGSGGFLVSRKTV
jgi:hypothetical protein